MQMADLEYYHLIRELKEYEGKYFGKIYRIDKSIFRVKLGSKNLILNIPNYAYLTANPVPGSENPDSFIMALRKRVFNRRIVEIVQPSMERIIEFRFQDGRLIFEMFSRGNIIYVNSEGIIELILHQENWKDRSLKRGEPYSYPPSKLSPFELSSDKLNFEIRRSLISGVLSVVSLSPKYMEEAFRRAGLDPKSKVLPSKDELDRLVNSILEVCNETNYLVYEDNNKPVDYSVCKLSKYENLSSRSFESLSSLVEFFYSHYSPKSSEPSKVDVAKKAMETRIVELEEEVKEYTAMGDSIYLHYNLLEQIIKEVKDLRARGLSDNEINKILFNKYKAKVNGYTLELEVDDNV